MKNQDAHKSCDVIKTRKYGTEQERVVMSLRIVKKHCLGVVTKQPMGAILSSLKRRRSPTNQNGTSSVQLQKIKCGRSVQKKNRTLTILKLAH